MKSLNSLFLNICFKSTFYIRQELESHTLIDSPCFFWVLVNCVFIFHLFNKYLLNTFYEPGLWEYSSEHSRRGFPAFVEFIHVLVGRPKRSKNFAKLWQVLLKTLCGAIERNWVKSSALRRYEGRSLKSWHLDETKRIRMSQLCQKPKKLIGIISLSVSQNSTYKGPEVGKSPSWLWCGVVEARGKIGEEGRCQSEQVGPCRPGWEI